MCSYSLSISSWLVKRLYIFQTFIIVFIAYTSSNVSFISNKLISFSLPTLLFYKFNSIHPLTVLLKEAYANSFHSIHNQKNTPQKYLCKVFFISYAWNGLSALINTRSWRIAFPVLSSISTKNALNTSRPAFGTSKRVGIFVWKR